MHARGPIICVVGARPNYMKMAPLLRAPATVKAVYSDSAAVGGNAFTTAASFCSSPPASVRIVTGFEWCGLTLDELSELFRDDIPAHPDVTVQRE